MVLIHSQNQVEANGILRESYGNAKLVKHRWWFPESTYRDLTVGKVVSGLMDRDSWRRVMDYWLFRKGVRDRLGSENAYIYLRSDFPGDYEPFE